jgi:hypothetical protein
VAATLEGLIKYVLQLVLAMLAISPFFQDKVSPAIQATFQT